MFMKLYLCTKSTLNLFWLQKKQKIQGNPNRCRLLNFNLVDLSDHLLDFVEFNKNQILQDFYVRKTSSTRVVKWPFCSKKIGKK